MLGEEECRAGMAASLRLHFVTLFLLQAVIITGVGLEVTLTPPVLTVFEGEDAIFTCSPLIPIAVPLLEQDEFIVTGDSHPRISFVDNAGTGQTQGNRTYTLRDVERSDNGTQFRCSVAGSRSDAITLTVYTLPQITGQSGLVTILENSPTPTILSYTTAGIPPPHSYQWLRNGLPFQGNNRVRVTVGHSSSLEVRSPSRDDSGSYTLVATSLAGRGTLTVELQIAYDEYLEVPQSTEVAEGAVVTLRCVHRFGWSYTWRSNRRYITRTDSKVSINPTGRTLRYGPVDYTDDLMDFYCVTRLENGHYFTSPSAILRVRSAPVIRSLHNYTVIEGSDIIITFDLLGHPSPDSLQYFMDGTLLDLLSESNGEGGDRDSDDDRISLLADRPGSLLIRRVKRTDSGVYSILARNSIGEGTASTQLIVLYAPIISPHQEPVVVQVNRWGMVQCGREILSFPPASFTWTKLTSDGGEREIQFYVDQDNGSLLLDVANYRDAGTYMCTAENSIGTTYTKVMVLVLDPPDPPHNLQAVQVGARWATLQWLPPDNVGPLPPLSLYKIVATPHLAMYHNSNDDDDVTEQSDSDDSIPAGTSKKGTPTPEGNQKTFSDDHSSGFANRSLVQGVDPNTTCVEVKCDRWTTTVDASLTVVNVTGLVPALGYEVVVHALSNGTNLISRPSRAVSITTQHSVPHIGSVSGAVYGPGAAHVYWTLAFSGGSPVQFFEIGFKKVNESEWWQASDISSLIGRYVTNSSFGTVPPDFRSWIVTGLEAREQYLFRVRAMNELGYGNYTISLAPILSHVFGVPSPHSRPIISGWAEDYVIITSSVSKIGLPSAENITVFVSLMENGVEAERQMFELPADYEIGSEMEFTFVNLSYRGDWQFTVSSSNALGESIPSPLSIHARDSIEEQHTAYTVAGPVVGCLMGIINLAVLTMVIILFTVMGQETHRQQRDLARRQVEMAHAEDPVTSEPRPGSAVVDCPFSPHSLLFRSSPDGRSNTHVTPSESLYAEIAHRTCPLTFTLPASTSSCTAV